MQTTSKKSESGPKTARNLLKPDDPEQSKHFLEAARMAEADEPHRINSEYFIFPRDLRRSK